MATSLQPGNKGLFETALEASLSEKWATLTSGARAISTAKRGDPLPTALPWLVYEYGLGELTPYVPNLYNVLAEGIQWQRVRGSLDAIARGLSWIGYSASVEEAWSGRNWWNSYQLRFASLPTVDDPDLGRVEGVSRLSVPQRSQLRRGVYQYDAGAVELDRSRLDDTLLERESGVAVTTAGTLWSFGRTREIEHLLTEAEGLAIGNWIEPPAETSLLWIDMDYPWSTATFPWSSNAVTQRQALMAAWFSTRALYVALRDGAGQLIGYRRCRAVRAVSQTFAGPYRFAGNQYVPKAGGTQVYIEAMTDFDDASGDTAAACSLVVGASVADGIPSGRLWLAPGGLVGGVEFATTAVSIPLRATVREQIKIMLRF
ncbi:MULTISPECIES: phage tail protein [unclassified Ensifer]|uniref:phage tail protein n=1 Tax=unclassified Ensifer TaxID=2633371 RepID=UPI000813084B|nr:MULTISPECIES: phage tail protein [unclassified Ensifer]OCP17432.1 hypothetical protein BC361_08215 [Ensifer sp. LC54]OCP28662.1 hypothetical protein BC363_02140 [Ensifer sp. LC384]